MSDSPASGPRSIGKRLGVELRKLGFAGSAPSWNRSQGDAWQFVLLETRRSSAPAGHIVTASVGLANKRLLSLAGADPTRPPSRADWHYENRVGSFLPTPFDRWWAAQDDIPDEQLEGLVAEVVEATNQYALPWLDTIATDQGLLTYWARSVRLNPVEQEWLVGLANDVNEAVDVPTDELPDADRREVESALAALEEGLRSTGIDVKRLSRD